MVAQHILDTVLALPLAEQLELVDCVRQRAREAGWPLLTEDQRRQLDRRLEEFAADPDEGSSWDEVEAEIRVSLGRP